LVNQSRRPEGLDPISIWLDYGPTAVAKARIRKDFSVKAANLLFPLAARAGGAVRRARWSLGGSVQPPRLLRALKQRHRDWHPNFDARQILAAAEFFSDFVVAQFSPDSTSAASVLMKVMHAKTSGTLKPEALSLTGP
jgi:hypothetical protein